MVSVLEMAFKVSFLRGVFYMIGENDKKVSLG